MTSLFDNKKLLRKLPDTDDEPETGSNKSDNNVECDFCHGEFSSAKILENHQQEAQYCLILQGKQDEIEKNLEKFTCPHCTLSFSTKGNLKKHTSKCKIKIKNITINNVVNNESININNNNNNLNLTLNIYGSTLSSEVLVAEIYQKLIPLLSRSVPNLPKMCQIAADNFVNEKGNPLISVSDASRNKFMLRYDTGDVQDIGGHKTRKIMRPPMVKASIQVGNEEALKLAKVISNDEDKSMINDLLKVLPLSLDILHPDEQKLLDTSDKLMDEYMIELNKASINMETDKKQEKALQDTEKCIKFLDKCTPLGNLRYFHNTLNYILEGIDLKNDEYNIRYKRNTRTGSDMDLTEADIRQLFNLGMEPYVDQIYFAKIEKIKSQK